jgi:cytochrome c
MRYSAKFPAIILALSFGVVPGFSQLPGYNLGRTPSADEISAWDIAVGPAGKELPRGSGNAKSGAGINAQKCAQSHGATAEGGVAKRLVGVRGLDGILASKTIGNFWPFATSIWDYVNRAMPRDNPGSLTPNEVYAVTAFLLYRNGIVKETDVIDQETLPKVQMPNRDGFVPAKFEDILKNRCGVGVCP